MAYSIIYAQEAIEELKRIRAFERAAIVSRIGELLAVAPEQESRTTIKRLRQPALSQYRLRVGDYRVFYRVENREVLIALILHKEEVEKKSQELS